MMDKIRKIFSPISKRSIIIFLSFIGIINVHLVSETVLMSLEKIVKSPVDFKKSESPTSCSQNKTSKTYSPTRKTTIEKVYEWDSKTQYLVYHSYHIGLLLTLIPGGLLADKFGGKFVFGTALLTSGVCCFFQPWAATKGPALYQTNRFVRGMLSGTAIPSMSAIIARWAPPFERGRFGAYIFSGTHFGNCFGRVWARHTLNNFKWDIVYYVVGIWVIVWFIMWMLFVYSDPESHPFITEKEKEFLNQNIEGVNNRKDLSTPWSNMLTSVPVISLMVCQWGHMWAVFTIETQLPQYLSTVLKFPESKGMYLRTVPFFTTWICALIAGIKADRKYKEIKSVTGIRKLLTGIASFGPAFCCLAATYEGCHRRTVAILLIVGTVCLGFYYPGLNINPIDLSPNYSGVLVAVINQLPSLCAFICPLVTNYFTPHATVEEYRTVYWIAFYVINWTYIIYLCYGDGEIQSWNNPN